MSFEIGSNGNRLYIQQKVYIQSGGSIVKVGKPFSADGNFSFQYTGKIIDFVIPYDGYYKLEAWGASGGSNSYTPPKGAYSKSYVSLKKNEEIRILVGEKCTKGGNTYPYCGGGGGGTFIAKGNTPLCVAGGGGTLAFYTYTTIQSHACGQSTQLGGNTQSTQVSLKSGGLGNIHGGGGGGFEGNGEDGTSYGKGGNSFLNGGERQTGRTNGEYGYGGFGGGGSRHGDCGYTSGGGGYTGGSAGKDDYTQGGGGGSYYEGIYDGEVSIAISGCGSLPSKPNDDENGYALITFLNLENIQAINKQTKVTCYNSHVLWTFYAFVATN